jgi:hypothetical protein
VNHPEQSPGRYVAVADAVAQVRDSGFMVGRRGIGLTAEPNRATAKTLPADDNANLTLVQDREFRATPTE